MEQVLLEIENAIRSVAIHFSEDPNKLKLSDCFTLFSDLINKIETALKENEMRRKQEERAARLAAERALQASSPQSKSGSPVKRINTGQNSSCAEDDVCVVDRLLADIRRGEFKLKKSTRG